MHEVPLTSTFLAAKFIRLSRWANVHLLTWDKKNVSGNFISKYGLERSFVNRMHRGVTTTIDALLMLPLFLFCLIINTRVRRHVLSGAGSVRSRIKMILYYLPLFIVKPDIVHFEFGTLAKDICLLKELTAAKFIVSFRGYDINYVGLNTPGYYDNVWKCANGIHFLGNDIKARAKTRGYKGSAHEALIAPGIDTAFFVPTGEHTPGDKLIIISVGRLVWKKGYEYGIRALVRLKEADIPFEYRIIGSGPHLQALMFTAHESGIEKNVVFLGEKSTEDVRTEMNNADLFLHPAISEGFCNAVAEAQAMALPVVCSNADGLNENIEDGVTGFVVPKWDVEAIAAQLLKCAERKAMLPETGKQGRLRATRLFNIEERINDFLKLYEQVYAGN